MKRFFILSLIVALLFVSCSPEDPPVYYKIKYDNNGVMVDYLPNSWLVSKGSTTGVGVLNYHGNTGFVFDSWNTSPDGKGTSYKADGSIVMNSDVVLYAIWAAADGYFLQDDILYKLDEETSEYSVVSTKTFLNGHITIPEKVDGKAVTAIADNAFGEADGISEITLPSGITSIGDYVFGNTKSMTVNYPGTMEKWKETEKGADWNSSIPTITVKCSDGSISVKGPERRVRIVYNRNGADSGQVPETETVVKGEKTRVSGNTGNLALTDHILKCWNTRPDGKGTDIALDSDYTPSSDTILYAKWEQVKFSITYDSNSLVATGTLPETQKADKGGTVTVSGNTGSLERDGYTFNGWCTTDDESGTKYDGGNEIKNISSDIILYARWLEKDKCTVTYNANGGTGTVPYTQTVSKGDKVTIKGQMKLEKEDYEFIGWSTSESGDVVYNEGDEISSLDDNVTLYAKWKQVRFKVMYTAENATSGSVPVDRNKYLAGETATVLDNTGSLRFSGYGYIGWKNTKDNTEYKAGDTVTITEDVTLSVVLKKTYVLSFNSNSSGKATGIPASRTYFVYEEPVIGSQSMVYTGYRFARWNTASDGSGTDYTETDTIRITSDITLYAQWDVKNYTVSFSSADHTSGSAPASQQIQEGTQLTVPDTDLEREHFNFAGWTLTEDGSGTVYKKNAMITISADTVLYAQWKEKSYIISFDSNNAYSGSVDPMNGKYGSDITLPSGDAYTREGYKFIGWAEDSSATAAAYTAGSKYTVNGDKTLYAVWEALPSYTVTYYSNGASSGTAPSQTQYYQGTEFTVSDKLNLKKTGYMFYYWTTSSDGSGTIYNAGDKVTTNGNLDLYAHWVSDSMLTYTYDSTSKTYSVTGYASGIGANVIIPSTYNSKPVTAIGDNAFSNLTTLEKIVIPESVTSIGKGAFSSCTSLEEITIPTSVTAIGNNAFKDCTGLVFFTIPSSVTAVSDGTFSGCMKLRTVEIPSSVTSIGNSAFYNCSQLENVTIFDNVISIGGQAFRGCSALTSLSIPSSVTTIGTYAFAGCTGLNTVTISSGPATISQGFFMGCTSITSITLPSSVTAINASAFSGCTSLTSITVPMSVTTIGTEAFSDCSDMTINYRGTKSQWGAITKISGWSDGTSNCSVKFSNGTTSSI